MAINYMPPISHRFYVGPWLVVPELLRIVREADSVTIEPKMMAVLVHLAQRPGEVISRDELLSSIWGDSIVTNHVLTRAISELRKVLGDDSKNPILIETIPKMGYRLIAPISFPTSQSEPAADTTKAESSTIGQSEHIEARVPVSLFSQMRKGIGVTKQQGLLLFLFLLLLAIAFVGWNRISFSESPIPPKTSVLSSLPGAEYHPSFSPDGQKVAYVWTGEEGEDPDLYVKPLGSAPPLRLTHTPTAELIPEWSPDGQRIAFRRASADCGVFVVPALGGSERKLLDCEQSPMGLAWAPDGDNLAVAVRDSSYQSNYLALFNLKSQEISTLVQATGPHQYHYSLAFSPDGQWLAFLRGMTAEMTDLYIVSVEEEPRMKRLTFDNSQIVDLTWEPNSQSLIFTSNRKGAYAFWRIKVSGDPPEWLSELNAIDPGWIALSPSGRRLAFDDWNYEVNIWQLSFSNQLDSTRSERLVASTRLDTYPRLSPDGNRLAFVSNRTGTFELWLSNVDGTDLRMLTAFDGARVASPAWSPDGGDIVAQVQDGSLYALYRISMAGGSSDRLSTGNHHEIYPTWGPDGKTIYYTSDETGQWQIWKRSIDGGPATQVTSQGGYQAILSGDSTSLWYKKYHTPGLFRLSTDGSPEEHHLSTDDIYEGSWTSVKDGIVFLSTSEGASTIWHYDPKSSQKLRLHQFSSEHIAAKLGIAASPSSDTILIPLVDRRESDIMVFEF